MIEFDSNKGKKMGAIAEVLNRIEAEQAPTLGPEANSLDFLQACYRNPTLPLSTRMRAAGLALPFELPKLAVTAVLSNQEDFATILDRRIARAREMRQLPSPVLEHQPNGQFRRRV
jgi:hypothetical protein